MLPDLRHPIAEGSVRFRSQCRRHRWGGRVVTLTKAEADVFEVLWKNSGRLVSKEKIMDFLFSLSPDTEPEIKIVDVYVCKIRRKLKGMGIVIKTDWGRGYRISFKKEYQNVG